MNQVTENRAFRKKTLGMLDEYFPTKATLLERSNVETHFTCVTFALEQDDLVSSSGEEETQ